ncbi:endolytic transglycosylase MltG [Egicoccus halophilus]|uniref:Endolytic murein transglycosylase n=1 Tax=Egicoccus halophilus TaxID=1670830 RepID=A0A8J3A981_9ACTN|nr:endolytic transglycosylase MltG [Egicoccus halophilus]GGI07343.1 aminodeoxychorismate lyase [Egicoccus halophilus]
MALSRGSKWFLGFLGVLAVGVGVGVAWLNDALPEPGEGGIEAGRPVELTVESGESVRAVGDRLADLGVIRNPTTFRIAAGDADLATQLQPGAYDLETGMGSEAAIDTLIAGPVRGGPAGLRFTVQEGLTVEQTLARLDAQFDAHDEDDFREVLDERVAAGANDPGVLVLPDWVPEPAEMPEEIVEPFEGLLFPETYEVAEDATPLEVLQRMVDQLAIVVEEVPADRRADAERRGLDRFEVLTLASLVERETRVDAERQTVAGVIENRLEEGMRLQIDASVIYAVGEPRDVVLLEDLEVEHPYNTYLVDGLPPGPISGMGRASLLAAFDPEDVAYRYYVLAPECDGSHEFAETLDEHNRNVAAFREAGRCQQDVSE